MSWQISYKCDDCGKQQFGERQEEFHLGLATPQAWTGFSGSFVYRAIYCPPCSEKLAEEGRRYLEERGSSVPSFWRRLWGFHSN